MKGGIAMDVRELITGLLEYDLDANVDIRVESTEGVDDFEISIDESSWGSNRYVHIVATPKDYVLVDKSDFEDMQKQIEQLEEQIAELEESK